jgi:hypothetical protein
MGTTSNISSQSQKEKCNHNGQVPAILPVHIRPGCEVDNEVVNLRRCVGDQIEWISEGGDFKITFTNSPFPDDTFHVPDKGSKKSGAVLPNAPIKYFDYTVHNVALAKSADPGANVKP